MTFFVISHNTTNSFISAETHMLISHADNSSNNLVCGKSVKYCPFERARAESLISIEIASADESVTRGYWKVGGKTNPGISHHSSLSCFGNVGGPTNFIRKQYLVIERVLARLICCENESVTQGYWKVGSKTNLWISRHSSILCFSKEIGKANYNMQKGNML